MKSIFLLFFVFFSSNIMSSALQIKETEIIQIIHHYDSCISHISFLQNKNCFFLRIIEENNPNEYSILISDSPFDFDSTLISLNCLMINNKKYYFKNDSTIVIYKKNNTDIMNVTIDLHKIMGNTIDSYTEDRIIDNSNISSSSLFVYTVNSTLQLSKFIDVYYRLYHPISTAEIKYWINPKIFIPLICCPNEDLLDSYGLPTEKYLILLENNQGWFKIVVDN